MRGWSTYTLTALLLAYGMQPARRRAKDTTCRRTRHLRYGANERIFRLRNSSTTPASTALRCPSATCRWTAVPAASEQLVRPQSGVRAWQRRG